MPSDDIGQYSSGDEQPTRVIWAVCSKKRQLEEQLEQDFELQQEEERIVEEEQRRIQKRTRVKCTDFIKPHKLFTNQAQIEQIEEIDDNTDEGCGDHSTADFQTDGIQIVEDVTDSNQHKFPLPQTQIEQKQNNEPKPHKKQTKKQTCKPTTIRQIFQQDLHFQRQQKENIFVRNKGDQSEGQQAGVQNDFQKLRQIWKDAMPQGPAADLGGWKSKGSGSAARNSGYIGQLHQALRIQKQAQDLFMQSGTTTSPESALPVTVLGKRWEGSIMKCRIETDAGQKLYLFINSRIYQKMDIDVGKVMQIFPPWQEIILDDGERVILAQHVTS